MVNGRIFIQENPDKNFINFLIKNNKFKDKDITIDNMKNDKSQKIIVIFEKMNCQKLSQKIFE